MMRTIIAAVISFSFAGGLYAECVLVPPREVSSHVRMHVVVGGKPFKGAKVIFYRVSSHGCNCATDVGRGNPLAGGLWPNDLQTDENGDASLPEFAPGEYEIAATINGIASTPSVGLHVTNNPNVTTLAMDLTAQIQRVEAAADGNHQVEAFRGTVQDFAGAAIPRASIVVVKKGSQLRDVVLTGTTDADGHFSGQLTEGSYLAVVFSQGFRPGIVAFEVAKEGSSELPVRLNIGGCP